MYHRLESGACPVPAPEERAWAIPVEVFEAHMRRLAEGGRTGVSMDQIHRRLAAGEAVPAGWVGITFDDGNASDYRHALPILVAHGFRATFFVCGERVDVELPGAHLREMRAAGMQVGSHAMTHRFMTTLNAADEERELVQSRAMLEQVTGEPVVHFAPPGGRWSDRTRAALKRAGYVAVSTSRYGFNGSDSAKFAYCRLPVTRATSLDTFDAMTTATRHKLWRGYTRAAVLGVARRVLGESNYGRARALGTDAR
jgi:peptidoglycan/xylan/chitin deacetylase (PgdA/CDA1 family)